ncbi:hypothetical protein BC937DRAFT_90709 [Endogone sp. FLAS-F59071]|nr:hypothetical protein BC937DRAFT_90709 [Endogone sp. FLAS-F59071]|eukprot:RUS16864.1 hypothetical protein BC937DRAFT_90709 [Endogone sp. FLAS-F59071]
MKGARMEEGRGSDRVRTRLMGGESVKKAGERRMTAREGGEKIKEGGRLVAQGGKLGSAWGSDID